MNKSELVDFIASKTGLSKKDSAAAVDAFTEAVTDSLKKNDSVTLIGFGTFAVREQAARTGRNPRTGEEISIAAKKVPLFRPGKGLKDNVNG